MEQLVQIVGALLILAGFVLAQAKVLKPDDLPYLLVNLFGAAALAVTAYLSEQWGFVLLEGVWTAVSVWGTVRVVSGRFRSGARSDGTEDRRAGEDHGTQ